MHFTTPNYDFFKHNVKVNSSLNSFLKRNDRFFFHKLTTKYKQEELLDYFVCNFVYNSKTWVGTLVRADGDTVYNKFKSIMDHFHTILGMIAYVLVMLLLVTIFGLMMFST